MDNFDRLSQHSAKVASAAAQAAAGEMSASDVLLTIVAPAIGLCCANAMFLAPLSAVRQARLASDLKDLNPLPFPMILANCILWVIYSGLLRDYFIFFSNFPGMMLGLFYTVSTLQVGTPKQKQRIEAILLTVLGCSTFAVVFGGALISGEHSVMVSVVGLCANVVLFLFYSAPLSVIASVIRTRCAKELLLPLSVLSTINGLCWTVYGAALGDLYIAVPNGVGCGLGIVQLVLIALFGNGRKVADKSTQGGGQTSSSGSTELEVVETSA